MMGTGEALALTPGQLRAPRSPEHQVFLQFMILVFIDWPDWSIKTPNLQLNADIILEIYVSIKKSSPFRGTRQSLCGALCIFIKAVKGIQGWGLRSWGGEARGRLSNCLHVNFKLNSPCPGTISALNANHFSGPFVATPVLQTLDCWWKNANCCTGGKFWVQTRCGSSSTGSRLLFLATGGKYNRFEFMPPVNSNYLFFLRLWLERGN